MSIVNRGLSVVSALSFGAGLMYLLDPDRGDKRRKQIRKQANSVARKARGGLDDISSDVLNRAHSLAEAGVDASERVRHGASDFGHLMSKRARKLNAKELGSGARKLAMSGLEAGSRARDVVTDLVVAEGARELAKGFRHSLRSYAIQLLGLDRGMRPRTWGLLGLVTGAGLMYIFDPGQGTQRRALVTEKVGQAFKGEGAAAELSQEASSMAHRFMSQVRSMVGKAEDKVADKVEEKEQEWRKETNSARPNYTPHA